MRDEKETRLKFLDFLLLPTDSEMRRLHVAFQETAHVPEQSGAFGCKAVAN